ncbi:hypothetical protein R6Q57_018370 [Mikania cordata]
MVQDTRRRAAWETRVERRLKDLVQWTIASEHARREGPQLPPFPEPRVYPEDGSSSGPSGGNSQKRENFWKKVTVSWHRVMGFDAEYRTYHQLNSKWKDMCTKLTKFSGIYSNCANNRKSEMNDENVLKWAEKEYQLKSNGQTFNHYHVWVAIKDSPKFHVLCQECNEVQGSSKRTKNSESNEYSPGGSTAHSNYAVNLEDDEEEAEFDTPPEPVRPTGRDTTKQTSSSSRQSGYSNPATNELADQLQAFTSFQKQKHEERKKYTKID